VELPHQNNGMGTIDAATVIGNHYQIISTLYDQIKLGRPVTSFVIRALHAAFVENQDYAIGLLPSGHHVQIRLLKGVFKRWPNNPHGRDGLLHQYCPPEQVYSEMERLVGMHHSHLEDKVPPDVEAAWLHHRFIQIHPFQDGNGRVARALASMVYIRSGLFPPVVTAAGKDGYIDSLESADGGDLGPFVRYLSGLVADTARRCMGLAALPENRNPASGAAQDAPPDGPPLTPAKR
jgi:Fic family protein